MTASCASSEQTPRIAWAPEAGTAHAFVTSRAHADTERSTRARRRRQDRAEPPRQAHREGQHVGEGRVVGRAGRAALQRVPQLRDGRAVRPSVSPTLPCAACCRNSGRARVPGSPLCSTCALCIRGYVRYTYIQRYVMHAYKHHRWAAPDGQPSNGSPKLRDGRAVRFALSCTAPCAAAAAGEAVCLLTAPGSGWEMREDAVAQQVGCVRVALRSQACSVDGQPSNGSLNYEMDERCAPALLRCLPLQHWDDPCSRPALHKRQGAAWLLHCASPCCSSREPVCLPHHPGIRLMGG